MDNFNYVAILEVTSRVRLAVTQDQPVVLDDDETGVDSQ
jgi:hypothetical protein